MTKTAMTLAPAMSSAAGQASAISAEPEPISTSFSPAQNPSPYDIDPRHAEVYQLADQGQTAAEIAAQLQRPHGEIQLILALRSH